MREAELLIDDGDVGGGPGPVYVVPEGPTTHYGHTLTDSILPLFATVQLRESGTGDEGGEEEGGQAAAGRLGGGGLGGWALGRRRRRVSGVSFGV